MQLYVGSSQKTIKIYDFWVQSEFHFQYKILKSIRIQSKRMKNTFTLSVENFIPSSISTSYENIEISIKSAPAELQRLYRQKNTCDVILKFPAGGYEVHKSVVEKSSALMKQKTWPKVGEKWVIDFSSMKLKIPKQLVTKMISCMYGYCVSIHRSQIQQSYILAKSMGLQEVLKIFHNDMMTHFDDYELFPLMKMANNEQIFDVIETCYDQLELEMYQPLRYSKSGCFLLDEELFKTLIRRHNYQKMNNERFGLSKNEINSLIEEYCFVNNVPKDRKKKIIDEIEDKQTIKYHISLNQVLKKASTPRKAKSSSEIFFRNTLTLPRQKDEWEKNNRRLSPFIKNTFNVHNGQKSQNELSPCLLISTGQFSKSQKSQNSKSISNYSTDNKSQQRSRRQSSGSIQILSNPKILNTINEIVSKQEQIKHLHTDMKSRTQTLVRKIKQQLSKSKFQTQKISKMESNLQEIKAEINSSRVKLTELSQTVNNVEQVNHKKQFENKFNSLFEKDIPLDLTLSRSFGEKERVRVCRI